MDARVLRPPSGSSSPKDSLLSKNFQVNLAAIFMAALNLLSGPFVFFLSAAVLWTLKPCCEKARQPPISSIPLYVQRGNSIQEHYETYSKRLQGYYDLLSAGLASGAPELLSMLEPPKPLQHGYQILPKIVADPPLVTHHPRVQSAHYSWPWTDHLIGRARSELERATGELNRALDLKPPMRQSLYEELARGYRQIRRQQQNIEAHIQYNRLWQAAIAFDRSKFAEQTVLHDKVLRRQAVRDVFYAQQTAALKSTGRELNGALVAAFDRLVNRFKETEKLLTREIETASDFFNLPGYVRVERESKHSWIVHVPFYTDIGDSEFVQAAKKQIENTWYLRSGEDAFRVELDFSYFSPTELYGSANPPQNGRRLNIQEHVAFFPMDRAVLTTGAFTTHVDGRTIILGPHDITPRVLAHEFGHIVGFKDLYFRGYKDRGENGFEVMEIVAEPLDIMGAPTTGAVLLRHYERIIKAYRNLEAQTLLIRFKKQ
jgi:hypothetical protein